MNYIFSIVGSLALPSLSFLLSNYAAYTGDLNILGIYGVFIAKSALISLILGGWVSHFLQNHCDVYSLDDLSKLLHYIIFALCFIGLVLCYFEIYSSSFGLTICCLNVYLAFIKRQQLWFTFAYLAVFLAVIQTALYFVIVSDWVEVFCRYLNATVLAYALIKILILNRRSVRIPELGRWAQVLGSYYILGISSLGSWALSQGGRVVLADALSFEAAGQLTLLSAYGGVMTTIAGAIWGPKHMSLLANSRPGLEKIIPWKALVKPLLFIAKILVVLSLVVILTVPQFYKEIGYPGITLVCIWYSLATIVSILSAGFLGNSGRVFFCWVQFVAGICALSLGWLATFLSAQVEAWLITNCLVFLGLTSVVIFRFRRTF